MIESGKLAGVRVHALKNCIQWTANIGALLNGKALYLAQ